MFLIRHPNIEANMHIRSFIGAALLGLAMMAFAPVAMADPAPDICVLDLSKSVTLDHTINTTGPACAVLAIDVASAVTIGPDDDDYEAAGLCSAKPLVTFAITSHRQHEDPGRCLA